MAFFSDLPRWLSCGVELSGGLYKCKETYSFTSPYHGTSNCHSKNIESVDSDPPHSIMPALYSPLTGPEDNDDAASIVSSQARSVPSTRSSEETLRADNATNDSMAELLLRPDQTSNSNSVESASVLSPDGQWNIPVGKALKGLLEHKKQTRGFVDYVSRGMQASNHLQPLATPHKSDRLYL